MVVTAIYIPGLGDKRKVSVWLQRLVLRGWRVFGLRTELFMVGWSSEVGLFDDRLNALLERIDELNKAGDKVALVGASAGASTAVTALAKRKDSVLAVVSICGQLRGITKVPEAALSVNPRFAASLQAMEKSLKTLSTAERQRILTLRPCVDAIVQPDEARLDGAVNEQMPIVGHLAGIGFAIVAKGRLIARFAKEQTVS